MSTQQEDKIQVYLIGKKKDFQENLFISTLKEKLKSKNIHPFDYGDDTNDDSSESKYKSNFEKADYVMVLFSTNWEDKPKKSDIFKEISQFYTLQSAKELLGLSRVARVSINEGTNVLDIHEYVGDYNYNSTFSKELYEAFKNDFQYSDNVFGLPDIVNGNAKRYVDKILELGKRPKQNGHPDPPPQVIYPLSKIMTTLDKLITFNGKEDIRDIKNDYNFRHFPITENLPDGKKLLKIVSIRDIIYGPDSERQRNAYKLHKNKEKEHTNYKMPSIIPDFNKELKEFGTEFNTDPLLFISIKENDSIKTAIEKLGKKQDIYVNGNIAKKYVGCLPVMDNTKQEYLQGIITYIDLLKHYKIVFNNDEAKIKEFLDTKISFFTNELPTDLIVQISEDTTLKEALNEMNGSGLRTLIIKDNKDSPTSILTDIAIKRHFDELRSILPVKEIAQPINSAFFKISEDDKIIDFIQRLVKLDNGTNHESQKQITIKAFTSFPVFRKTKDKNGIDFEELVGIIGYTDILKRMYHILTGKEL